MVTIRKAKESDIPRILELYQQLAMNPEELESVTTGPEFAREMFLKMTELEGYHLLVAVVDGEVMGTAVLVILPGLAHGISHWGVVEFMVVDETHRSRGIGQVLMDRAAELAQEAGCYKIMLGSNKKRTDAHRFYRKAGYTATHEGFTRYFK
ncbi:MAG: GNAT family N-acetyltransferase [Dehalococcoidia bacterium]